MPAASRLSVPSPDARDRLLEAASSLFASHGYQAIGLRDLAGHLGLRAGSLYHHIESKQGLLFELIESSLTDLLYETRQCLKGSRSNGERLQRFVQAFISFSQAHPDRLTLLTREAVNLNAEQLRQVEELKGAYSALLSEIIIAECGPASAPRAGSIAQAVLGLLCGQGQWGSIGAVREQMVMFVQGIVCTGKVGRVF
ncbi:TetR/AcrR family transcriptional regulator [Pseudomonas sp. 148P]|uniref:TetR/AcrR family transcriptional regulator n=1 Tax=Pseudomonas ulcerans TaxID=3115852 RepID=A0ABU7I1G4_9PSED|nr:MULTISPECIES: TetR/AcrR family transcriptional regulator [unclassified Pseudomonas]MEE1924166.1 TetR/AcrR family transcriptional regulator [Pseudomonas sp. 147P]MEE1937656.1 TetR/AcrR family transcriptional regulator [Pseudomonas sp. 148P]